ncbi:MAG: glycosyltransferase family 25 protein [Ottowia sp.]|nr:glycosyltransferase family 25 protein [Ottowia sp.]
MRVFIINLPKSVERLQFQKEQMARLGLSCDFIPAVSTDDFSDEYYEQNAMGWERPLRKTELACYMSHKRAWESVLASPEPALILEDDALLSRHALQLLDDLKKRDDYDLVTLEVRGRKKILGKTLALNENHALTELYQDRTGAAAYVLRPSGAKILLDKAKETPPGLADAFISSTYELKAFQVEPAAAIQLDQCGFYNIPSPIGTASVIDGEAKPLKRNLAFSDKLSFKMRRIASQVRMGIRQLNFLFSAKRRNVKVRNEDFTDTPADI